MSHVPRLDDAKRRAGASGESCHSSMGHGTSHVSWEGTGWRRFIGCLKLQVIFRKRATDSMALLRKMTHEERVVPDLNQSCHL